jgi:DNA-binding NtrC family response regulator
MPNRPKILLIDDNAGVCSSFRDIGEKQQFEVAVASTVAEGVDAFKAFGPDVVVLVLALPDGSGMEAFRATRAANPMCPVVFITAHGTIETALEAMREGAFNFLTKPVELDYLWPGNVRELQSVVKEAMVRTRGRLLLPEYLPESVRGTAAPAEESGGHALEDLIASLQRAGESDLYARVVQAVDRVLLAEVLRQTHGNQLRASEVLGIDRKTLRQKLRNLGLIPNHVLVDAHDHLHAAPARGDWSRFRG